MNTNSPSPEATTFTSFPFTSPPSQRRSRLQRVVALLTCAAMLLTAVAATVGTAEAADLPEDATSHWQAEGTVNAVLAVGTTLYIGGDFTALYTDAGGRVARNNLAAINLNTGEPTSFNPNLNDKVFALVASDSKDTLYVGGAFTMSGTSSRKRIAAYNTANGNLRAFNPPAPNSALRAMAIRGDKLYIGGLFERVGDADRGYAAAIQLPGGTLDANFNPNANARVTSLIADPNKIWLGGDFSRINGARANFLAAVAPNNGNLINTDHPGYPVIDLAVKDDQLFVAGGGPGGRAASYNRWSGNEQWTIASDGNFQAVDAGVDYVYFGGHYENVEGTEVGRMTRHNFATGALDTGWLPLVNGLRSINAVDATASTIAIGGDFTHVSRDRHEGFATFELGGAAGGGGGSTAPLANRTGMTMHDLDENGYIDTVRVRFDRAPACAGSCPTDGWRLINAPSGSTLRSAFIFDTTVALKLNEGSGDPDTAAENFKVSYSPPNASTGMAGFNGTAPDDLAGPVPLAIRKTNVGTAGIPQAGDTFQIDFSEGIAPSSLPWYTTVRIVDPGDGRNDRMSIDQVTAGLMNLGSDNYVVCVNADCGSERVAAFYQSRIALTNNAHTIQVTLAGCSGACDKLNPGSIGPITYKGAANLTDDAGNTRAPTLVNKTMRAF